jgi:predicted branched-subunit amino acid permease
VPISPSVEPEFGRDFTVAVVLIAAIVALATGSIPLGLSVIAAAIAVLGVTALVRSKAGSARTPH